MEMSCAIIKLGKEVMPILFANTKLGKWRMPVSNANTKLGNWGVYIWYWRDCRFVGWRRAWAGDEVEQVCFSSIVRQALSLFSSLFLELIIRAYPTYVDKIPQRRQSQSNGPVRDFTSQEPEPLHHAGQVGVEDSKTWLLLMEEPTDGGNKCGVIKMLDFNRDFISVDIVKIRKTGKELSGHRKTTYKHYLA